MGLLSSDNDHGISSSYGYMEHKNMMAMMEKRQLFLRSYQFCRKRSVAERIKTSLVGFKRVVWSRLRSARKLRRMVLSRIRLAFFCRRRRYAHFRNNQLNPCYLW